jgi:8-oxo-dGTP pyrophosphatase MutT (NUDIX family)
MNHQELIATLRTRITQPLPGFDAHKIMAPYRNADPAQISETEKANFKKAAVMVLLFPVEEKCHFALIQRPDYEGVHGGQVSFPGGKLEPNETYQDAALREMYEEIGVAVSAVHVMAQLTQVYIPPSKMYVTPFIAHCPVTPTFITDSYEVSELLTIPLEHLFDETRVKTTRQTVGRGTENAMIMEIPYFDLHNKKVWGATAVILSEMKELLR